MIWCIMIFMNGNLIYTVGYSGYGNDAGALISDLLKRGINVLIDVRSNPYSGYFNEFDREKFAERLEKRGIKYRDYAKYFGAKQEDGKFYTKFDGVEERIDYEVFTKSELFKDGAKNVQKILDLGYRPALMCSEKDPAKCHRAIMVARALKRDFGFDFMHIVPGKRDETQEMLERRVVEEVKDALKKNKRKMNKLEETMKNKLNTPLFRDEEDEAYINDVDNYYRIVNSRIGWTRQEVLGYQK